MTLLTVLVLIIGVFVLMIAAFVGISYGLGHFFRSREGAKILSTNKDPCAHCNADRDWYEGLPLWKQNAVSVWWWVNRITCETKGCK